MLALHITVITMVITIRISDEMHAKLRQIAREESISVRKYLGIPEDAGISMDDVIRYVIAKASGKMESN